MQFVSIFPMMVMSLLGGVLADRIDRGLFIIFSRSIMAVLSLVMAVLVFTGLIAIWQVVLTALAGALLVSIEVPARMATYPSLVAEQHLPNAVTLNIVAWNVTSIVGPAIAGPLVTVLGVGGGYAMGAGLQVGAVVFFILLKLTNAVRRTSNDYENVSLLASMADGLRYLRGHSVLFPLLLVAIAPNAFGSSYFALLPAFAADVLKGDAALYGSLLSAGGIGAAIATVAIALAVDIPRKGLVVIVSGFAVGLFLIFFSQMQLPLAGLLAAAILGLGQATFMTINSILVQSHVDEAHRGRAMSVLMMIFGFGSIGTLGLGALAFVIGVPTTFALAGAIIAITVLVVTARFPQLRSIA